MKMAFHKTACRCLRGALRQVQNAEQTQEIRLTEDLPDIGSILGAWGQFIARGKEWRSDCAMLSGGLMVWVLYKPEDGSALRCVDTWIPFQLRWPLPDQTPEGTLNVHVLTRFVDARTVSPRKIMVRGGVGAYGQMDVPVEAELCQLDAAGEDVELLRRSYPVRLSMEAGEKAFLMEETVDMPVEQLIYYSLKPEISDCKVLSDKVAFRGNGNLHMLYLSENGTLHSENFLLPFSQFAELRDAYSSEAQAVLTPVVTELELHRNEDGSLELKAGISAQYVVDDLTMVETVEDAYSPGRSLTMERQVLELPAMLEKRTEQLSSEQTVPGVSGELVDMSFLPDFPKQFREDGMWNLEAPGTMQMLYRGEDGTIHSANARWEGKMSIPADDRVQLRAVPNPAQEPGTVRNGEGFSVKTEVPLNLTFYGGSGIPMLTALEIGEEQEPDAQRPSLILRRAGEEGLWEIAKLCGSTMEAIRRVNGLEGEPAPGQMLLVPVR